MQTEEERKAKKKAYDKKYMKEYNSRPEVKARIKEYQQRPEVKIKRCSNVKKYYNTTKGKEKIKKYNKLPEVKARRKEYRKSLKFKEHRKEYNSRPRVKARRLKQQKEYSQRPEVKSMIKERMKEYNQRPEVKIKIYANVKKYCNTTKGKKYRKEYKFNRYNNDNIYRIRNLLRKRLYQAMKNYTKNGKIWKSRTYGVDYQAIIEHLMPFPENISEYHIDHIRPLCSFDLEDPEQVKQAFAAENHQWLLAYDNISKGGRYLS